MLSWQSRNSLDREVNTSNVSDFSWLNITFLFLEVRLSRTNLGTIMLPKDRCCFWAVRLLVAVPSTPPPPFFAYHFVNSDWLELVIYFHSNKQGGEQNAFMVDFSDNNDLRRGFKASLRNVWDRDISRTAESHRYIFRSYLCFRFVTNWLWKILNISSSASDRSPLLSRTTSHYIYRANKLSVSLLKVFRSY